VKKNSEINNNNRKEEISIQKQFSQTNFKKTQDQESVKVVRPNQEEVSYESFKNYKK
jgi:hypothetical protein